MFMMPTMQVSKSYFRTLKKFCTHPIFSLHPFLEVLVLMLGSCRQKSAAAIVSVNNGLTDNSSIIAPGLDHQTDHFLLSVP